MRVLAEVPDQVALELGAVVFIAKPGGRVSPRLEEIQKDLIAKVLQSVQVRMENLRRRAQEERAETAVPAPPTAMCPKTSSRARHSRPPTSPCRPTQRTGLAVVPSIATWCGPT